MCCHLCECLCVCVCGREPASEHIYSRIDHALAAPPSLLAQHGVHTHDTRNTHHTQAYTHTCTHTHHDKKAEARRRVCTIAMPHHVAVSMCVRVSIRTYVCAHGDENQSIHTKPFEVYTPSLSWYTHQAFCLSRLSNFSTPAVPPFSLLLVRSVSHQTAPSFALAAAPAFAVTAALFLSCSFGLSCSLAYMEGGDW